MPFAIDSAWFVSQGAPNGPKPQTMPTFYWSVEEGIQPNQCLALSTWTQNESGNLTSNDSNRSYYAISCLQTEGDGDPFCNTYCNKCDLYGPFGGCILRTGGNVCNDGRSAYICKEEDDAGIGENDNNSVEKMLCSLIGYSDRDPNIGDTRSTYSGGPATGQEQIHVAPFGNFDSDMDNAVCSMRREHGMCGTCNCSSASSCSDECCRYSHLWDVDCIGGSTVDDIGAWLGDALEGSDLAHYTLRRAQWTNEILMALVNYYQDTPGITGEYYDYETDRVVSSPYYDSHDCPTISGADPGESIQHSYDGGGHSTQCRYLVNATNPVDAGTYCNWVGARCKTNRQVRTAEYIEKVHGLRNEWVPVFQSAYNDGVCHAEERNDAAQIVGYANANFDELTFWKRRNEERTRDCERYWDGLKQKVRCDSWSDDWSKISDTYAYKEFRSIQARVNPNITNGPDPNNLQGVLAYGSDGNATGTYSADGRVLGSFAGVPKLVQ